ncbi:hypothetical protein DPX16_5933 [Anabarilius grahami]|uniref:Uncharacterized protein n=1 Tax=Anabarilius grahami TaxID=495550 RepID=A0A3N0Y385_ANAGA|nr:hypothetical protein DPX16_5933 [Anabarilius grahami]
MWVGGMRHVPGHQRFASQLNVKINYCPPYCRGEYDHDRSAAPAHHRQLHEGAVWVWVHVDSYLRALHCCIRSVQKHSGMFLKRKPLISRYALYLAFSESQPHICVSCHIERDAPDG